MHHLLVLSAVFASLASPVLAGEATPAKPTPSAEIAVERHYTTNALDSTLALDDWNTTLRGALAHEVELSGTKVKVSAAFQASLYDTYDFEDDISAALALEATRRLSDALEIRGTLSWRHFSEGDDLPLAGLVLATRTPTDTLAAGGEAGLDLGHGLTLVMGALGTIETPGDTRFPDLAAQLRLHPRRETAQLSAVLTRSVGSLAYGLRTSLQRVSADPYPLGVGYRQFAPQIEAKYATRGGLTVAGALGAQYLAADEGLAQELRPVVQLAVVQKFTSGLELRGSYAASFESNDTDDPLASYLRRLEVEVSAPVLTHFTVGAGLFLERKSNLLLDYEEKDRGIYGEIVYHLTPMSDVTMRVDWRRDTLTLADEGKTAVDAYVGVARRL